MGDQARRGVGISGRWAVAVLVGLLPGAALADPPKGFRLDGERFTFDDGKGTIRGILVKPAGKGPFPAVLISHGLGSTAERFARPKVREFVKWGFVCLAPDYTHSDPQGDRRTFGASTENLRRARQCLDLLASLPEVDARRVCAYGNSMGAFVTVGLAAAEPGRLAAAAITAGGVNRVGGFAAPAQESAAAIRTPFCILHGTRDTTVPPERSALLESVLKEKKVDCQRHLFEGVGHDLHSTRADDVGARIKAWFEKYTRPK
jgi:dipeptidyl aminopeptidase/acylaminoacyl peptidase